jgi:hypothetical protein
VPQVLQYDALVVSKGMYAGLLKGLRMLKDNWHNINATLSYVESVLRRGPSCEAWAILVLTLGVPLVNVGPRRHELHSTCPTLSLFIMNLELLASP